MRQEDRREASRLMLWAPVVLLRSMARMCELVATMRGGLLEAIEDEKSAVLALTDEAAQGFADRVRQTSAGLEKYREEMEAIVRREAAPRITELMKEFNACWPQFRKLDEVILELATQNTNCNAQRLSASQCAPEVERFEEILNGFMARRVRDGQCDEVVRLSYEGITAGLKILALHKPHIEAASDREMDALEGEIRADNAAARTALAALLALPGLGNDASLQEAETAYGRFMRLTAEVLRLSRLNTNIKSVELSLGKKRLISAQCQNTLAALQESVQSLQFKATE